MIACFIFTEGFSVKVDKLLTSMRALERHSLKSCLAYSYCDSIYIVWSVNVSITIYFFIWYYGFTNWEDSAKALFIVTVININCKNFSIFYLNALNNTNKLAAHRSVFKLDQLMTDAHINWIIHIYSSRCTQCVLHTHTWYMLYHIFITLQQSACKQVLLVHKTNLFVCDEKQINKIKLMRTHVRSTVYNVHNMYTRKCEWLSVTHFAHLNYLCHLWQVMFVLLVSVELAIECSINCSIL